MTTRNSIGLAAGAAVLLITAAASAGQMPMHRQAPQQEHQMAQGDMAAKCQAMMKDHEKMMADQKAADERLEGLAAKMNAASGQAKIDATAAVVAEIVAQRKTMHQSMMKMHQGSMMHMMEHMQAGKESMAMCPMMKGGGH